MKLIYLALFASSLFALTPKDIDDIKGASGLYRYQPPPDCDPPAGNPEPATILLMASGMALVGAGAWRKRTK